MSQIQIPVKIKNPLLEFCLLHGYTMCLGYFTQNLYETVDSFLLNAEQVQNFISIHPNILSTLFFAQLDWFKQGSNGSVDGGEEEKNDSSQTVDSRVNPFISNLQPVVQLTPIVKEVNEGSRRALNRVSNDGDFAFIKNKLFSIAGFEFPTMPVDFQILNVEMNDALLSAYTTERISAIFRDVCQLIWKRIKPAYPDNVPEQCLHEICAVFVYKFPVAQKNFEKIRKFNPTIVKPHIVDIGVILFFNFSTFKFYFFVEIFVCQIQKLQNTFTKAKKDRQNEGNGPNW